MFKTEKPFEFVFCRAVNSQYIFLTIQYPFPNFKKMSRGITFSTTKLEEQYSKILQFIRAPKNSMICI